MSMNQPYHSGEDDLLWQEFQRGNKLAFKALYNRYSEKLFQYGLHLNQNVALVKDSVQELFVDLWKSRGSKSKVDHLQSYLLTALRYKLLRKSSFSNRFVRLEEQHATLVPSFESNIITKEIKDELAGRTREILNNLPPKQKEVIHLRFFQGLGVKQIADLWLVKPQSISNLLQRSISNLRKNIQKKNSA